MDSPRWVFGYGSLIWRQDFPWRDSRNARITGWERRFWQGSHDHRGVATAPGRVVTLVESPGSPCYGRAFLVEPEVFEHLDHREKNGYERHDVEIRFDAGGQAMGTFYVAAPGNFAYLGDAPIEDIAGEINRSVGPSGTNREYVLELARALREMDVSDPHVFEIEALLLAMPPAAKA